MRPWPSFSLLALSEDLYCRLLIAYPQRFRREYGREMALVFRSHCRSLVQQHGDAALAQLWFSTLADLVATALAERMKEGFSMPKTMWVQLSGLFAFMGGLLGIYLALQGANEYGNYGWDGDLAPIAALLLAVGFTGWFTVYYDYGAARGWAGFAIGLVGLLCMALGHLVEALWFLMLVGPSILVPIGTVMLGVRVASLTLLPAWWRYWPLFVATIGILGFGIEAWEDFVLHNSRPDRGVQTIQLLFSVLWIGLSVGLWSAARRPSAENRAM